MRLDTTSICMWYQFTSRLSPYDATNTSLSTSIISTAIWIQVSGQRQYGCKHLTQQMMHEHMTQSTMHMFTTIQRLYSTRISTTEISTAIFNDNRCTCIHQQFHQHLHVIRFRNNIYAHIHI